MEGMWSMITDMEDQFKSIRGRSYSYPEYEKFPEEKWLSLFRFFEAYLYKKEDGEDAWECSKERLDFIETVAASATSPAFYGEFLARIDRPAETTASSAFILKINSLCQNSCAFLKKNPRFITGEMVTILENHKKKMGWALDQYKTVSTPAGDIVQRDDNFGGKTRNIELPSLQAKVYDSMLRLADLYNLILDDIKPEDVKNLALADRLKLLRSLSFVFALSNKKVVNNHFTQINMNKTAKDQEKAMLEYVNKKS